MKKSLKERMNGSRGIQKAALLTGLSLSVMALAGCGSSDSQSFTLVQDTPDLVKLKENIDGSNGRGDVLIFKADLTRDGEASGKLVGALTTIDLPESAPDNLELRTGTVTFLFSREDSIIVSGGSVYPRNQLEMEAGRPQVRAVTGGTGEYVGAKGQAITQRQDDGTYTHQIELID